MQKYLLLVGGDSNNVYDGVNHNNRRSLANEQARRRGSLLTNNKSIEIGDNNNSNSKGGYNIYDRGL